MDKATNNYTVICKMFYIVKVESELSNTGFCTKINVEKDDIVKKFFA